MSITLKPSHFDSFIVAFPSWISNGAWGVRRDQVVNGAIFSTEAAIAATFPKVAKARGIRVNETDDSMTRIHAAIAGDLLAFTVTSWTYDGKDDRFALLTCEHRSAFIPRAQLAMFGNPAVLYSVSATSAFTDAIEPDDRTFVIMPAVIAKDGSHLKPLISLVHLMDLATDKPIAVLA